MKSFLFFPEYLEDAKISIIGAPYDLNSSRRYGSRFAPDAVRAESRDMETNCRGIELSGLPVEDLGNLRADNWSVFTEELRKGLSRVLKKGSVPVVIGGDHSISPEIIKSIGRRDVAVVSIDAHLDFDVELYGNTRGHSTARRREAEIIGAENITVFGARTWSTESMKDAREMGMNIISSSQIHEHGIDLFLRDLPEKDVYLTIDIDGIDPSYAPGTGTPEPFGLKPRDVLEIIHALSPGIVGMDLVEICPPCDINGITSILGAHLILEFISSFFSR